MCDILYTCFEPLATDALHPPENERTILALAAIAQRLPNILNDDLTRNTIELDVAAGRQEWKLFFDVLADLGC